MQETRIWSLGRKDSLEKGMVTYSSILAWRMTWTDESGSLQSKESRKFRHSWVTNIHLLLDSVDYKGYSISSKVFLPTVVDTLVIWIKFTHSCPFLIHLFLTCWYSLLPSPAWPCPYTLIHGLTVQVLCKTVLYSIRLYFHHQTYPKLASLPLWPSHLILSGAISKLPSALPQQKSRGCLLICGAHLLVSNIFAFYSLMGFSQQKYWSGWPFPPPVDNILSELSTMSHPSGWPCLAWLIASLIYTSPFVMKGCDPLRGLINDKKGLVKDNLSIWLGRWDK